MHVLAFFKAGPPILFLPAPTLPAGDAASAVPPHGTMTLRDDIGGLEVSTPRPLFAGAVSAVPGFPPVVHACLRQLPGLVCVATDPFGFPVAEWIALQQHVVPAGFDAAFPPATAAPAGAQPRAEMRLSSKVPMLAQALGHGVHAVVPSHSWPPGARVQAAPPVNTASILAYTALADVIPHPFPPAGAFFGGVAVPLAPRPHDEANLAGRAASAMSALRDTLVNGQSVGANLLRVLDGGISVSWADAKPPEGRLVLPESRYPSPPPCGWDGAGHTIYLAAAFHPSLDAPYLAAALYAAYTAVNGHAAVARLASAICSTTELPLDSDAFIQAAVAEAARAWVLTAEISRAQSAVSAGATEQALSALAWGRPAIGLLPSASISGPAYDQAIAGAVQAATASLTPVLSPSLRAFHDHARSLQGEWTSPARLEDIPRAAQSGAAATSGSSGSARSAAILLNAERCTSYAASVPAGGPEILYESPVLSPIVGAVEVDWRKAAPTGVMVFARQDGTKVVIEDVPATLASTLLAFQQVTMICVSPNGAGQPQTISVHHGNG